MRFLIAFLLWASPLLAEVSFPSYTQLDSKIGPVVVLQVDQYTQQVYVNGQAIVGLDSKTVNLHGVYNHSADGSQTILLTTHHGGNGCFDDWIVLRIANNQLMPSAPFGGCGRTVRALRLDTQGLELDMHSNDLTHAYITYRFGSAGFTAIAKLRDDTAVAPAASGRSVTRWVGSNPSEVFSDAAERVRFRTVMADDFLNDLRNAVSVSNGVIQQGDYVYGAGCWPHTCNAVRGVWALRISDGAVFAVIWSEGGAARIAGASLAGLPTRMQNFALTGVF